MAKMNSKYTDIFRNESATVDRASQFLQSNFNDLDSAREEFRHLLECYQKLLTYTAKITRLGDSNQRKLHNAIQQIQAQKEELRDRKELLKRLNKAKDEILGIVAHDLRTPVNTALGYSEILLDEYGVTLGEDGTHLIHKIKSSCHQMTVLIGDLLEIAKLESEDFNLNLERTDIREQLIFHVEENRDRADGKKHRLCLKVPDHPVWVPLNKERFQQICQNLISNAIKFTEEGGSIDVVLSCKEQHVLLSIRDTGIGIPADHLPHLFKKFTRASRLGTRGEASIGLGMNIIHNLVELHGGRIWVESTVGVGTNFFIELPYCQNT